MKVSLFFVLIHASISGVLCRREGSGGNTRATNMTIPDHDLREDEKGDKVLLSRKRRFLTFPEGSAFVSTLSIVKALQFTQSPPTNLLIEFDVIWPIPSNKKRFFGAENRMSVNKRFYRPSSHRRVHRREKRDLYSTYEAALDSRSPGQESDFIREFPQHSGKRITLAVFSNVTVSNSFMYPDAFAMKTAVIDPIHYLNDLQCRCYRRPCIEIILPRSKSRVSWYKDVFTTLRLFTIHKGNFDFDLKRGRGKTVGKNAWVGWGAVFRCWRQVLLATTRGLPGKECILRTICEARSVLSPPGVSFLEDMLRILLSNVARSENEMDEYDLAYKSKKDCDLRYQCPFSIMELLLSFDQNLRI